MREWARLPLGARRSTTEEETVNDQLATIIDHPFDATLSRRQVLKFAGYGVGVASLGSLLAACGGSSVASGASSGLTKVSDQLGYLAYSQFAGYFAAEQLGYYAQCGLDDKVLAGGQNLSSTQLVAAGTVTYGDENNDNILQAIEKGIPVKLIGALYQKSPYAVMSLPAAPIRTLADFQGKTIAILAQTEDFIKPLMVSQGLDPNKVHWVPAAPDGSALLSGAIQGYTGYSTSQGVGLQAQAPDLIITLFDEIGLHAYANVLIARNDTIANRPHEVIKYVRATSKGYRYVNQHPDEWGPIMATKYGPPGENGATETKIQKAQAPLIESALGPLWIDIDKETSIIADDYRLKVITKQLAIGDVVATDLVKAIWNGWKTDDALPGPGVS